MIKNWTSTQIPNAPFKMKNVPLKDYLVSIFLDMANRHLIVIVLATFNYSKCRAWIFRLFMIISSIYEFMDFFKIHIKTNSLFMSIVRFIRIQIRKRNFYSAFKNRHCHLSFSHKPIDKIILLMSLLILLYM